MHLIKQPQLAPNQLITEAIFNELPKPLYVSHKYDGVRCLVMPEPPYLISRSGKPHPNRFLARYFADLIDDARKRQMIYDGELWFNGNSFGAINGLIRAHERSIEGSGLAFYCFDALSRASWLEQEPTKEFICRLDDVDRLKNIRHAYPIEQWPVNTWPRVQELFTYSLNKGFEGLMLRSLNGGYKHGRATLLQNLIYKLKQVDTADAVIIDFEQASFADEESKELDEFGYMKTFNRVGERNFWGGVGSFVVRNLHDGMTVKVGSGFTLQQRAEWWAAKETLRGKHLEYKYQKAGMDEKARFPVFVRFRPDLDENASNGALNDSIDQSNEGVDNE